MAGYEDRFRDRFQVEPEYRISAPGRVNLIGEHIDYLDGWVMPAAIEPCLTMIVAAGSGSGAIEIYPSEFGEKTYEVSVDELTPRTAADESWLNYVIGVLAVYAERGIAPRPCRVAIFSTLPTGAGLSSSAALETATGLLVEALAGESISVTERALLCQRAEHEWVGVPCGIMDQLSIGAGVADHVLKIDCRETTMQPVRLPEGISIVVADSGVKHALGDGEYRKRREDCDAALEILNQKSWREISLDLVNGHRDLLGNRLFLRARHAVTEMKRVADFASALEANQFGEIGQLMREGHDSLRDDYEVSCAELDALVDAGYDFGTERGQIGSRMTGGGFGGSTVHLVHEAAAPEFLEHLKTSYRKSFDRDLHCFVTRASDGARCDAISTPALHS